MVGVILVTYGNLGRELLAAVKHIVGEVKNISFVSIDTQEDVEAARKRIQKAIQQADSGKGVLVLTDILGSTPANLSLSFLEELNIEVLSGVNLPILVKLQFLNNEENLSIREIADLVKDYGCKNISVASHLLSPSSD